VLENESRMVTWIFRKKNTGGYTSFSAIEAVFEIIILIMIVIFEITIHVLVLICPLVMSIFSPLYRQRLKDDWESSRRKRFSILLEICFYSVALMIALIFWVPVIWAGGEFTEPGGDESVIGVQLSSKKDEEVDQKEKVKELVEFRGDFIKRRLE
jgi:hypothetical protein